MAEKEKRQLTFDQALVGFTRSTKQSMSFALLCSMLALEHFAAHGDLVYCQRFFDNMPTNWTRKQAYLKWLVAHAPIAMVNRKFVKDTSEHASPLNLEAASKKPFWDFAPEMEPITFSAEDLDAAIIGLVKRFHGKRYLSSDPAAAERLTKLEILVQGFTGIDITTPSNDGGDGGEPANVSEPQAAEQKAA